MQCSHSDGVRTYIINHLDVFLSVNFTWLFIHLVYNRFYHLTCRERFRGGGISLRLG